MKSLLNLFGVLSIVGLVVSGCADPISVSNTSDEALLGKKDRAAGQQTQSIVDIAAGNPNFSILVDAVSRLGLVNTLANDGQFTVFAPTDSAFADFLVEFGFDSLGAVPLPLLEQVVLYHVVDGRQFSNSVLKKKQMETLQGEYLMIKERGVPTLVDANGRESNIITSPAGLFDIPAKNGVVHAIRTVVAPYLGS
jgi:uncharacterized surface protein with fasciclin (FAS1) repeats